MRIDIQLGERGMPKHSFRVAIAVLCLVLLALLTFAQATHLHKNQTAAEHCQLCIAMHSAMPTVSAAAAIILVALGVPTRQAEPTFVVQQRFFRLFIRPPPVSC